MEAPENSILAIKKPPNKQTKKPPTKPLQKYLGKSRKCPFSQ